MALYYEIDKKDYEESWSLVRKVFVKAIFHKNMKYLFFHNIEKDCYVLPTTEVKDGIELCWIDLEKSNPEKRGRNSENFDVEFDMAVAEYTGIIEDIGKWLGDKMTSKCLMDQG